jgi:hypothetical protein
MLSFLYSFIWNNEEKISLCPNSFSKMPENKFHNYIIIRVEPDED